MHSTFGLEAEEVACDLLTIKANCCPASDGADEDGNEDNTLSATMCVNALRLPGFSWSPSITDLAELKSSLV
jgi:hypothetical protein